MRPYDSEYDDFDDFDDFDFSGVRAIRHMVDERQRRELRLRGHRRARRYGKNRWDDDEWSDYDADDYADYDADEFDTYSGLSIDQH
ncbi:MAG: hypothetical protein OEN22_07330 [Gammaproteobacteria bacterium]|nr:hypothetical protein [Gammaproteobacteria bacterium]